MLLKRIKKQKKYDMHKSWQFHTMVIPGVLFFIFIKYIPLLGTVIAFQDYNIFKGIVGSPWVGLQNFITIFSYYDIYRVLLNTFRIGLKLVVFSFPVPIILALLINEINGKRTKRFVQSILYLPYFFSWVLIANLVFKLLGSYGPLNNVRDLMGLEPLLLLNKSSSLDATLVFSNIWRDSGWGTIVYLAAIAGVPPSLYESAAIDGANRVQRMLFITFPQMIPTIIILLLLRLGQFLDIGFDFIYQFITPINQDIGDIVDTYSYRVGIIDGKYSLSTALGICKAIVGFVMISTFNFIAKKSTDNGGLW